LINGGMQTRCSFASAGFGHCGWRTVVIKPSELSSPQTRVLVEALHEADPPKGLMNVVTAQPSAPARA
jgi:acyl-CoA reductase-like NAD-dependent aldehyde dehydrogenase